MKTLRARPGPASDVERRLLVVIGLIGRGAAGEQRARSQHVLVLARLDQLRPSRRVQGLIRLGGGRPGARHADQSHPERGCNGWNYHHCNEFLLDPDTRYVLNDKAAIKTVTFKESLTGPNISMETAIANSEAWLLEEPSLDDFPPAAAEDFFIHSRPHQPARTMALDALVTSGSV